MGKKRSAARRATATAAAASAATPSPAIPSDTHAALVDTPFAPAVRESPTNTQQPRVSHEADATRAPRAASPAHLPVETTLAHEPANGDTPAAIPVAVATPQLRAAHALDSCPEQSDTPPALTTPTSTSNDVSAVSLQQPRISQHADTLIAPRTPVPALSTSVTTAVAVLAAAIEVLGSPTVFLACPMHSFDRAEDYGHEFDALAPRVCPAMTTEEIDEDLLENIIEDAQNQTRIEARREVRVKALQEGRERGWKEGLEEGKEIARREARRDARAEVRQREQSWKDGYEQGRWEGYREGLEVARAEVSTTPRIDATVQADDAIPPHPRSIDRSPANPRVDAHVQTDNPPCPQSPPLPSPSRANSPPPIPVDKATATSHVSADVQTDDRAPTLSPPTSACNTTPRIDPATPRVDTGVQSDPHTPTLRACIGVQADAPADSPSRADLPPPIPIDMVPATSHVNAAAQTDDHTPTLSPPTYACAATTRIDAMTLCIDAGVQSDVPVRPLSPNARIHAGVQYDPPPSLITHIDTRIPLDTSAHAHVNASLQSEAPPHPFSCNDARDLVPARTPCTFLSDPRDDTRTSHKSSTTPNVISMSHNATSFSWADDASLLPVSSTPLLVPPTRRDFSILRSPSARPFDSLKRRARRSHARPTHASHQPCSSIPISEPVITRRHPAGLRVDRPIIVSSSSPIPHSVKLKVPPLDWQGDPRLQELGRVLRGLGWVQVSGS